MKVKIEIECDTVSELHGHLSVLKKQLKKEIKRLKLDTDDELNKKSNENLYDNNCYGVHSVKITNPD